MKIKNKNLPLEFKSLLWSYDFSMIEPEKDKKTIIVNTINYGQWQHWIWIIKRYGKEKIKEIIKETPVTAFRFQALKLVSLLLGIKKMNYASRNDYIKAKMGI